MPSINGHEMAQEVIDLIEHAAANDNAEALQWLMNQPVLESGWCIDTWLLEDLEALGNTLSSIDSDQKTRLLTEINIRLGDKKESAGDDDIKLAIAQ